MDPEGDRPWLCQQRVPLEVNGILTSLHTLYDWESVNTLVRKESARRIGLQAVRAPRRVIMGYQGEGLITDKVYYLPLLDSEGHISDSRPRGRRDYHRHPHKAAACGERNLPCHQSRYAMDGNWCGTRGIAHWLGQQAVVACPQRGFMGPGRRHEVDEVSFWPSVHDHGWMGEEPFPPRRILRESGEMRQRVKPRIRRKPKKSVWRTTGAGVRARDP
jgi:hypothetical protein